MANDGIGDLIGNSALYLGLGIAGLFFGFFFLLIGALVGTGSGFGGMFYVCGVIGLIPGIILIALVFKMRRKDEDLESLGEILQAYRRIKMSEIARKLGVNEFEAERRVAKAIDMGFVKGYIDRNTHEFFTVESMSQVIKLNSCPKCGAPREKLYLAGEEVRCGSCGSVV